MASYIYSMVDYYNYIFYESMDKRVSGWFLMDSPFPMFTLILAYILFVVKYGPEWMKRRKPFNLENIMMAYNVVQMFNNLYFVHTAMIHVWIPGHYNWICQTPIYEPNITEDLVVSRFYLFFISRLLDLLDTVFMVLRKSLRQVSFLHLYHHVLVATGCWVVVKYQPGGHTAFFGTVNAFVHVVMYFYYFLTAIDTSYKKSIWWKRHITELQLAQFVLLFFQQMISILSPKCAYSKYVLAFYLSQAILMIVLFSKFYINNYIKPPKVKK